MAFITWRRDWDAFQELEREVDRLFDSIRPQRAGRATRQYPAVNLFERDDEYILTADMPGVQREDLDVTLTGQVLNLKMTRRLSTEAAAESFRRRERPEGTWTRTLSLPERVDAGQVAAELSDGVLRVHLPKTEAARPRQIQIAAS